MVYTISQSYYACVSSSWLIKPYLCSPANGQLRLNCLYSGNPGIVMAVDRVCIVWAAPCRNLDAKSVVSALSYIYSDINYG